jgi:ABC-type sugar transport system ATPase subunit
VALRLRFFQLSAGYGEAPSAGSQNQIIDGCNYDLQSRAHGAHLSGGNRREVMLARGLTRDFQVFLFDEPTIGIDVGAR